MPTTRRPDGHSTAALWLAAESVAENALTYSRPGTDAVGTQSAETTNCHWSSVPPVGSTASTVNPPVARNGGIDPDAGRAADHGATADGRRAGRARGGDHHRGG